MNIICKRGVVGEVGTRNIIAIGNNTTDDLIVKKWDIAIQHETEVDILVVSLDQLRQMRTDTSYISSATLGEDPDDVVIVDNPTILDGGKPIKYFNINSYTVLLDERDNVVIPEGMGLVMKVKTGKSQLSITTNITLDYAREEN